MEDPDGTDGWVRPAPGRKSRPKLLRRQSDREGVRRRSLVRWLSERFTIMVVPHSDQKVTNIQVPGLVVMVGLVALVTAGIIFIFNATSFSVARQDIGTTAKVVEQSQAELDVLLAEFDRLQKAYQQWQDAEEQTLRQLNIQRADAQDARTAEGDLALLDKVQELAADEIRQLHDIKQLTQLLGQEAGPLGEIARVLKTQKNLLSDIPNIWPVAGGVSYITMEFGPNRHPVTDRWFIHRGIDIAALPDLPVVASANGKVVEAAYDEVDGYGAYILIEHKNSVRTRYAHLGTFLVKPGDEVFQGQSIGTLGNSGLSTYYHVEFQIMIGTQVLDPASFLKQTSGRSGA